MTTKHKIIGGFAIMVLLIAGMATASYREFGAASERFVDYSAWAKLNVNLSDSEVELEKALAKTYSYVMTRNKDRMKEAYAVADSLEKHLKEGEGLAPDEETRSALTEIRSQAMQFKKIQSDIESGLDSLLAFYTSAVRANTVQVASRLAKLSEFAQLTDNADAQERCSATWINLASVVAGMGRYVYSGLPEEEEVLEKHFADLEKTLSMFKENMLSSEGVQTLNALAEACNALHASYAQLVQRTKVVNDGLNALRTFEADITRNLSERNKSVDRHMRGLGVETLAANDSAQREMLFTSGVGVVVGMGIAALIVFGIMRVLADLGAYAGAIARGDFTHRVKTREKGEIGRMIEGMQHIPEVLQRIINTADALAQDIRVGGLRNRLEVNEFHGSFADLAVAVNTVGDAYTKIIDDLPLPVLAVDSSFQVQFFNQAAQKTFGGNSANSRCSDGIQASICKTPDCLGARAMKSGANHEKEIPITCNGKEGIFNITAVPLKTAEGNPGGFINILTDLTEIRTKEHIMRQTAEEAAEISTRVAAASEELAAQVEQISRGAEVQRDRVTSTAGAMTQMNATVIEVARSAGEASEQSEGTRQKAQEGAELVHQVMTAINAVNTVGQNLQSNMQELGKQAESIGSVMNVISDIADQTNLLALNAAIEAARAGEAGRGFAVVADEVRKLAEKTMEATQEVGSSIHAVQQSARVNIEEVSKAVASVAEANSLADSSGAALAQIVNLAAANSSVVASIATAAEEQSATSEEISRAIDEINHVVGETTEGMVQSSAAVQDLSQMAQQLRRVMENLR